MYERVGLILLNLFFSNLINVNTCHYTKQNKMPINQYSILINLLLTLDKRSIVKQGTLDYFCLPGCFVNKQ